MQTLDKFKFHTKTNLAKKYKKILKNIKLIQLQLFTSVV